MEPISRGSLHSALFQIGSHHIIMLKTFGSSNLSTVCSFCIAIYVHHYLIISSFVSETETQNLIFLNSQQFPLCFFSKAVVVRSAEVVTEVTHTHTITRYHHHHHHHHHDNGHHYPHHITHWVWALDMRSRPHNSSVCLSPYSRCNSTLHCWISFPPFLIVSIQWLNSQSLWITKAHHQFIEGPEENHQQLTRALLNVTHQVEL